MTQDGSSASKRIEDGKARRRAVPRAAHAELGVAKHDRDIVAMLEASNHDRLEQLVPVRHSRMLESPFAFFRGSAVVQAADLSATPNSPGSRTVHWAAWRSIPAAPSTWRRDQSLWQWC
jgi:hypothetical protein